MPDTNTLVAYFLSASGWLIFSYMYISVGEHQIHKLLMHRKQLPAIFYQAVPYLYEVFAAHAVRHHATWYKEFDYEPDAVGREENIPIPLKEFALLLIGAAPLWLPIFFISIYGGCIFLGTALAHNRLWTILHRQMHMPRNVWYKDSALFRFVAINHFLHHQNTRRHLNVAFPFADFLFGTRSKPTREDIRELMRLGYVSPRSDSAKRQVKQWQEATALRREQSHY